MKNLFKTAFILLTLLIISIKGADAAVLSTQYLQDAIKKDLIKDFNSKYTGKVNIEITGMPYKTLTIPDGKVKIDASVNTDQFNRNNIVRVKVSVDNNEVKSFGVPVRLTLYDNVWVAKEYIAKGESLSGEKVIQEKREIGLIANNALRGNVYPQGITVRKSFGAGEIIDTRFIKSIPAVAKNSPVSIVFQSPYVTVTISGEALDSGKVGDFIRVRNNKYKKDYKGKIIGSNTILVNI